MNHPSRLEMMQVQPDQYSCCLEGSFEETSEREGRPFLSVMMLSIDGTETVMNTIDFQSLDHLRMTP